MPAKGHKTLRVVLAEEYSLMKVIIAGIVPFLRTLLRMAIEEEGFVTVAEAEDPSSLLMLCDREKPDILILDLELDEPRTLRLIEDILDLDPTIAIVAVSDPRQGYGETALAAGARAYLQKPFSTYDLVDTMRKVAPVLRERR
ncbi:MAG: response regulator [Candidatus Thorarchaeota archaeon]|nr:response regulator [Candidatus Thorarchaeota archaeon]